MIASRLNHINTTMVMISRIKLQLLFQILIALYVISLQLLLAPAFRRRQVRILVRRRIIKLFHFELGLRIVEFANNRRLPAVGLLIN